MSLGTSTDRPAGLAADEPGVEPRRIGRFALLRRLGAGTMGVVYAAYDPQLDRKVAVKLMKGEAGAAPRWQDRLLREAQALAKLSHPNVVQIHDVGSHGDEVFVAMEFVTGMTLRTWLSEQHRSWREIVAVFAQAARGLAAAHAAGLVHRDVKPDNILVGADGRVRVVDFGLVRFDAADDDATDERLPGPGGDASRTATGALLGTPAYMAPEQFRGRPADALSDQFGLCVALYEALHGERPFAGETADEVAVAILRGQVAARPSDRRVPAWLGRLVLRGLAHDRAARWPDLDALAAELARDHGRRARRLAWLGAALVALAALVGAVLWVSSWRDRAARERAEALAVQRLRAAEDSIDAFLRAGRTADAAAVLDAFVAVPEHQGTRALADALRGWGERLRARGDIDGARAAHARAYAAALDPAAERAILGEFVRLFHEQWSWGQLGALCELLQAGEGAHAWVDRCAEAAFARRDFAAVAAARARAPADPTIAELAPLAAAWARATPLAPGVRGAGALDVDGDGRRELYLHVDVPAPGRLDIVAPTPELTPLRSYPLPSRLAGRVLPLSPGPGDPAIVVTWSAAHRRASLSATGPERLVELASFAADEPLAAAAADLDRDGAREVYLGTGPYGRVLLSFEDMSEGPWQIGHPHPETDATNSDIHALVAADLDGDGGDELIVAAGPWRAFDVRVLRPRGPGRDALELVARRKLGAVQALGLVRAADGERLLAAAKTDVYRSKISFPADAPTGAPAGVYLLRLRGRELETVRFLAAPRRAGADAPVDPVALHVGDVDGDGLDDLVVGVHDESPRPGFTVVHRQRPDGSFATAALAGLAPLALVELDDDPGVELVARDVLGGDERTWLLGVGAVDTPALRVAHPPPAGPPALADPLLARAWQRAEQLAALDLSSEAGRALDDLAGLLPEAPRAAVWLRAAALHEAAGEHLAAAQRYELLADDPDALLGAARCYEQAGRFADALRLARVLAARTDLPRAESARIRARLAQLAAVVEDVDAIALRFDQPLPDPWIVDDPTAARQDLVGEHLQLDAFASHGPIARLPFEWSTGPLGLDVELALDRAEWGSGLVVGMRPAGSPDLLSSVRVEVLGGGGVFTRRHGCQLAGAAEPEILSQEPGDDPARATALSLALELLPELGRATCSTVVDGARSERSFALTGERLPPPGRWELVILPLDSRGPTRVWTSARLRAITLRGARPAGPEHAAVPDPALARAARLLVHGEADAALGELARVAGPEPRVRVWQSLALSELGRWDEASAALRAGGPLADPGARAALLGLLRARRQSIAPLVRAAFGPQYFHLFWEAMADVVRHHGDPLIERTLTTALSDLSTLEPGPGDLEGHVLKVQLLFERGRAWAALRQPARARADLAAAAALVDLVPPERRIAVDIDYERAALEATEGERDAALEFAARALLRAPARELLADRMRFDPRFAALAGDRGFRDMVGE